MGVPFAEVRRSRGRQRYDEIARRRRYLIDGALERLLVRVQRFAESGNLTHELQGSIANLVVRRGGFEVEQRANVAAHVYASP